MDVDTNWAKHDRRYWFTFFTFPDLSVVRKKFLQYDDIGTEVKGHSMKRTNKEAEYLEKVYKEWLVHFLQPV